MHPDHAIPRIPSRIVLVGFMGAGKSTTGPILATRLGWRFIDADRHIEEKTGLTVADFFSSQGEAEFRRVEAEVVADLHREQELVLALGGGAIENESTRRLLSTSSDTCMIFLRAPLEVLMDRCARQSNGATRPLLSQRDMLARRFHSRQRHYETAHISVDTQGLPPLNVAELILERLQEGPFSLPAPVDSGEIKAGHI
jgi:shikimate kinase